MKRAIGYVTAVVFGAGSMMAMNYLYKGKGEAPEAGADPQGPRRIITKPFDISSNPCQGIRGKVILDGQAADSRTVSEAHCLDGKLHGAITVELPSGIVAYNYFKNGEPHGPQSSWYPDGTPASASIWIAGQKRTKVVFKKSGKTVETQYPSIPPNGATIVPTPQRVPQQTPRQRLRKIPQRRQRL
jgi:hypothetical protein